jgi:predicted RNase H-like HicB family nuclease
MALSNTYTAIFQRDDDWYVAYCPEVPGANGQGRTKEEARNSLASAIELILLDRREDALTRQSRNQTGPIDYRWG